MPRCSAFKPDGTPCERIVGASQSYCFSHDPERSDERRRNASKAAKSKPSRELHDIKAQLQSIADQTIAGELDVRRATASTQALNALLRAVEVERRVREAEELETRLAELEARAWSR